MLADIFLMCYRVINHFLVLQQSNVLDIFIYLESSHQLLSYLHFLGNSCFVC